MLTTQRIHTLLGWAACLIALLCAPIAEANDFPTGWEAMEIEAKWDASQSVFNAIVAAFPDNGVKYGYNLNVRWSGRPRRYTDLYYDNPANDLFNAMHALRHRQRASTSSNINITDSFSTLEATTFGSLNWQKVQYKSTPVRLAAVWFRNEKGGLELNSTQVTNTLAGNGPHPANDDPVLLLTSDHPSFDFSTLDVILEVTQFRYRVEFKDPMTGTPVFELSMDKIVTTVPGGTPVRTYGVELEVLQNVESRVEELLSLMQLMEAEFGLTRAVTSKGGLSVPDSALPVMRLEETLLDYGQVELGFAFTKVIVVHNDGYAPLVVSVKDQSAGDPDRDQWSERNEASDQTVTPGEAPLLVPQVYEPDELGTHSIQFEVTSDDQTNASRTVVLSGEGISPVPIDSVLVLDRSGSMSETAGQRQKIHAMRDAADLYAHLLRPGTGDQIGYVKYNNTNQIYLPLDFVDDPNVADSHMAEAEDKLSDAALTESSRLRPLGATGIGGAMETAAGMLVGGAGGRKHVMVVLTDGIENRDPLIDTVIGPIQSADPELAMYSVGVGSNIEPQKLQAITNVTNGYHQVSDDLSGESLFDLETFYFKIFSNATGMQLVVDPTVAVPLVNTQPIVVDTARITSSDRKATFLALDNPALRKFYHLELVAPNGQTIGPGGTVGGLAIQYVRRHTYTIYKIVLPDADDTTEYLGDWILRLTPRGHWDSKAVDAIRNEEPLQTLGFMHLDPTAGLAPVGFAAAVASNYRMQVAVLPTSYLPGAPVVLGAILTDKGWPAPAGHVAVDVTTPNGDLLETVSLRDDGVQPDGVARDGRFAGKFIQTGASGSYRFVFRGSGRNTSGELAPREAARYLTLMQPIKDQSVSQPCIPCYLQWLIIIVFGILLLWLVWVVMQRPRTV